MATKTLDRMTKAELIREAQRLGDQLVQAYHQITLLQGRLTLPPGVTLRKQTVAEFCSAYCLRNQVTSVPGHVVQEARKAGVIA